MNNITLKVFLIEIMFDFVSSTTTVVIIAPTGHIHPEHLNNYSRKISLRFFITSEDGNIAPARCHITKRTHRIQNRLESLKFTVKTDFSADKVQHIGCFALLYNRALYLTIFQCLFSTFLHSHTTL